VKLNTERNPSPGRALRVVTADRSFVRAVQNDDQLARYIVLLADLTH
jgi:hypothetical protein